VVDQSPGAAGGRWASRWRPARARFDCGGRRRAAEPADRTTSSSAWGSNHARPRGAHPRARGRGRTSAARDALSGPLGRAGAVATRPAHKVLVALGASEGTKRGARHRRDEPPRARPGASTPILDEADRRCPAGASVFHGRRADTGPLATSRPAVAPRAGASTAREPPGRPQNGPLRRPGTACFAAPRRPDWRR